jgi:hypothetical protein
LAIPVHGSKRILDVLIRSLGTHLVIITLLGSAALLISAEANAQARGANALEQRDSARLTTQIRTQLENTPEARAQRLTDLKSWLRRLSGQFRVTGEIWDTIYMRCATDGGDSSFKKCFGPPVAPPQSFKGVADCVSIGSGPGTHCLFNVGWNAPRPPFAQIVWDPWLDPGIMLFGLDPDALGIRYLQVDYWSIAEESVLGKLENDRVMFKFRSFPYSRSEYTSLTSRRPFCPGCKRTVEISASPDGRTIKMSVTADSGDLLVVYYDFKLERLSPSEDLTQVQKEMRLKQR